MSVVRSRRTYNASDPTAMALFSPPRHNAETPNNEPTPAGGVTMAPAARMQARSFGLHPYQIAKMQRKAATKRLRDGHQFQFMSHQVLVADNNGITTITHVM